MRTGRVWRMSRASAGMKTRSRPVPRAYLQPTVGNKHIDSYGVINNPNHKGTGSET